MAFGQVGDEARIALAEADQGLALLFHPAHREATLAAIAPGDISQRWKQVVRGNVADALQVLEQHALLGQDLLRFGQVLQRAAAAGAEVRAARVDAIRSEEESRGGKGCVRPCRTRWTPDH